MKRNYSVEDWIFIYKRLKEELPFISLSNDIIVGYPTETEKDFKLTLDLMKKYSTDVMNISRFWPRPGTLAARLKMLPGRTIKERSRKATTLFHKLAREDNKKWLGWEGEVFFDEIGKDNSFIGRNFAYKPIIVKSNLDLLGKKFIVRISETTTHDLRGYIIDEIEE
jgi:tRNA A37 methylthiotransferase MiaB